MEGGIEVPVSLIQSELISILCSDRDFVAVEQSFCDCEFGSPPVSLHDILIEGKGRNASASVVIWVLASIVVPVVRESCLQIELIREFMLIAEIQVGPFIDGVETVVVEYRRECRGRYLLLPPLIASRNREVGIGEFAGVVIQVVSVSILGDPIIRGGECRIETIPGAPRCPNKNRTGAFPRHLRICCRRRGGLGRY